MNLEKYIKNKTPNMDNFKYTTKLFSIAFFTYFKIITISLVSTIIVFIIELILLLRGIDSGHSAHVSAIPFSLMFLTTRPIGAILCLLTFFLSPMLFFVITNKYVITKLTHKIINDKSESLIIPAFDKFLSKFLSKQPKILKDAGNFTHNKLLLIQNIQNDRTENKWLRKIIIFGMKKIKLDDVDFDKEGQNFSEIVKLKTIQQLKAISEPNKTAILLVLLFQWLSLFFIWITKY
ncbi:hypothetical protein BWK59_10735 [Flavobacterium davisii]|uniref:Uncharacterized protein n=1 Tax=Flavobacterium davisii TaxID=2906077 RepID=A0A246GGW8_9FLAO|nr:hypothetical protein [Flavobacterium davisii]OWP83405.1 hypothetical protein BWK59_10735 [Flavobacterium davisii]